jgi:hypothetical protein
MLAAHSAGSFQSELSPPAGALTKEIRIARSPAGSGAMRLRHVSISPMTSPASLGVIRPSPTAARTALVAFAASLALLISGRSSEILPRRHQALRQSLSAVVSPASPSSIVFRVSSFASPSSSVSAASVARLRTPLAGQRIQVNKSAPVGVFSAVCGTICG